MSTDGADLTVQADALVALGVPTARVFVDTGMPGTRQDRPDPTLCSPGDTLAVTELERVARSLRDATGIDGELTRRKVLLNIGGALSSPMHPVGQLLPNLLGMVAELESDLVRARTRESMAPAKVRRSYRAGSRSPPPLRSAICALPCRRPLDREPS